MDASHFLDPLTQSPYLVGVTTSRKGKYQVAATIRENTGQVAKVVGNYKPRTSQLINISGTIGSHDLVIQDSDFI